MRKKANCRVVCEGAPKDKYCALCDSREEVREFKSLYICEECINETKKI